MTFVQPSDDTSFDFDPLPTDNPNSVRGVMLDAPRPHLRRRQSGLREVLGSALLVAAIYALVNLSTVRFMVEGPSMEPTFHSDQFLIVSRVHYLFGDPQRGDIVVFHAPGNPDEDYIKRLIGLPGETIEFSGQDVYINGQRLS
jgi:signal peptidase I